jgi:glucokinase
MTMATKTEHSYILAIDAGGTYFKSALINGNGALLPGSFYQLSAGAGNDRNEIIKTYENIIRHASSYALAQKVNLAGIGISTPGPFDYQHGICLMKHKFPCLYGVNIAETINAVMPEITGIPLRFRHDANSFLAGEMWRGAAQGFSRTGGVTLGTGIGVACCTNGEFLNNELGSPAPEVSVWNKPYGNGIVEDYVSSRALVEKYRKKHHDYAVTDGARGIAEAAKQGDHDAMNIYTELGADLGNILLSWCERFTPEAIIFGGQISQSFELFAPQLRQIMNKINNPPVLVASQLGTDAALYGVASLFLPFFEKKF